MKKQHWIMLTLISLTLILSGCTEFDQPISSDSDGFWNEFIVWPLVSVIKYFADLLGTYAWGIIVVTLLIRTAILPLMIKQAKSSKQMQVMQPKMQELQKKYASKDQQTQMQYQQEMANLMKESGVNPLAGCLPIFIQMPILIGFYHAISRMNATPEFILGNFFMFPLAEPSAILAITAGAIQYIVLFTGPAMNNTNPQMKIMLYVMPLMIIGFGMVLPAALSLYWVIGNLFTFVQNLFIYKPWIKEEEAK